MLARLSRTTGHFAKKWAAAKLRALLEPILAEKHLTWLDVAPVLKEVPLTDLEIAVESGDPGVIMDKLENGLDLTCENVSPSSKCLKPNATDYCAPPDLVCKNTSPSSKCFKPNTTDHCVPLDDNCENLMPVPECVKVNTSEFCNVASNPVCVSMNTSELCNASSPVCVPMDASELCNASNPVVCVEMNASTFCTDEAVPECVQPNATDYCSNVSDVCDFTDAPTAPSGAPTAAPSPAPTPEYVDCKSDINDAVTNARASDLAQLVRQSQDAGFSPSKLFLALERQGHDDIANGLAAVGLDDTQATCAASIVENSLNLVKRVANLWKAFRDDDDASLQSIAESDESDFLDLFEFHANDDPSLDPSEFAPHTRLGKLMMLMDVFNSFNQVSSTTMTDMSRAISASEDGNGHHASLSRTKVTQNAVTLIKLGFMSGPSIDNLQSDPAYSDGWVIQPSSTETSEVCRQVPHILCDSIASLDEPTDFLPPPHGDTTVAIPYLSEDESGMDHNHMLEAEHPHDDSSVAIWESRVHMAVREKDTYTQSACVWRTTNFILADTPEKIGHLYRRIFQMPIGCAKDLSARYGPDDCELKMFQGLTCPTSSPTRAAVDCEFSSWSPWTSCADSTSCGDGVQTRTRAILTQSQFGGAACPDDGATKEAMACTRLPCPNYCATGNADWEAAEWSEWSACTRACGPGSQTRHVMLNAHVMPHGCPSRESRVCNAKAPCFTHAPAVAPTTRYPTAYPTPDPPALPTARPSPGVKTTVSPTPGPYSLFLKWSDCHSNDHCACGTDHLHEGGIFGGFCPGDKCHWTSDKRDVGAVKNLDCPSTCFAAWQNHQACSATINAPDPNGICCHASHSGDCGKVCNYNRCARGGGEWVPVDNNIRPYTCVVPSGNCPAGYSTTNKSPGSECTRDLTPNPTSFPTSYPTKRPTPAPVTQFPTTQPTEGCPSGTYSRNVQGPPSSTSQGRCGPLFGDRSCSCTDGLYCNEVNGWCGSTPTHDSAQASTKYDCTTLSEQRCFGCPAGKTSTGPNAAWCDPCAAGHTSLEGDSECKPCKGGQYHPSSGGVCHDCLPGRSSGGLGATGCEDCSINSFAVAGAESCTECAPGRWTAGAVRSKSCHDKPTPKPTQTPTSSAPTAEATPTPTRALERDLPLGAKCVHDRECKRTTQVLRTAVGQTRRPL